MMWMLLMAAIGTFDFLPSSHWQLPELDRPLDQCKDTLYDSLDMTFIGNWPFGPSHAVAADSVRDIVFLGSGGGVYVLDVSNPSSPTKLSEAIHTRGSVKDMCYDSHNQVLYIADGKTGLEIWNVVDPVNPVRLGDLEDVPITGVAVSGASAYVVGRDDGLCVIDVSDPASPCEVGRLGLNNAWRIAVLDSFVYVTGDYSSPLKIIDVSDPTDPQLVRTLYLFDCMGGVAVRDSHLYVIADGLYIFDVSDPSDPREIGHVCSGLEGLVISGSCAYVAGAHHGLGVVDISDPYDPQLLGSFDTRGYAWDVTTLGSCAFVVNGRYGRDDAEFGLRAINVSDPLNMQEIARYDVPDWCNHAAISGSYAYIAASTRGLRIIDLSDISNPVEVGYYDTPGYAFGVAVCDSYAYVADGEAGLRVISMFNPSTPQEVGYCSTPGSASGVAISGPFVYVADSTHGLRVISISDPGNPEEVGACDTPGKATAVTISGSNAYVADGGSGFRIIDVSQPSNPREVGSYSFLPDHASDVAVSEPWAYVAYDGLFQRNALEIFDVSNVSAPQSVGFCTFSGVVVRLAARHPHVYVATEWASQGASSLRIWVIDVSAPSNMVAVGMHNLFGGVSSVVMSEGSYIYLAGYGLQIYDFYGTGVEISREVDKQLTRIDAFPNPTCGQLIIEYEIPSESNATVRIHDAAGREVLSMVNGLKKRGRYLVSLNASSLQSGVYFVELKTERVELREKFVLVK
jgi:hypothetical protein